MNIPFFENPRCSNQSRGGACSFPRFRVVDKFYSSHSRSQQRLMLNIKQDTEASLENSVDNVAADGGSRAEDSSIAHLLAEFFALLFQFTVLTTLRANSRTGLSKLKRHVAIVG